jgi:hypothetical protein
MATVKEEGYLKGLSDEALGKKLKETLREIDTYMIHLEHINNLLGLLEAKIEPPHIFRDKHQTDVPFYEAVIPVLTIQRYHHPFIFCYRIENPYR